MPGHVEAGEADAASARDLIAKANARLERLSATPPQVLPEPTILPAPGSGKSSDESSKMEKGDKGKVKEKKEQNDPFANGFGPYLKRSLYELLLTSQLNWLLLCTFPALIMAGQTGEARSDVWIFTFSLLAIAPFAERLSFVTEQLALHTSEVFGGLLNATFGNVTELIVSLFALKEGLYRIVQVSLLGSILSNLLLVLGTAFLVGGAKHPEQRYSKTAQTASFGLLLLSAMCLTFPMVLDVTHETIDAESSLLISRITSILMLVTYCLYLVFQLYTHSHIFDEGDDDDDDDGDDDDEEEAVLGVSGSIFWLAVITVFIAVLSEYLVDAIRGASTALHVPDLFLGTIVIPIVGNAAEHAAAIIFAAKNKMELALGIAVGSAVQIALFVMPLCVVIAWSVGAPLSMDLHPFETAVLLITVLLVGVIIQTGESNWLAGLVLVMAYVIISIGFFYHTDTRYEDGLATAA